MIPLAVAVPAHACLDGQAGGAAVDLVWLARAADVDGVAVLVADLVLPFWRMVLDG